MRNRRGPARPETQTRSVQWVADQRAGRSRGLDQGPGMRRTGHAGHRRRIHGAVGRRAGRRCCHSRLGRRGGRVGRADGVPAASRVRSDDDLVLVGDAPENQTCLVERCVWMMRDGDRS